MKKNLDSLIICELFRGIEEKDIPAIYDILKAGTEAAREVAAQTMAEVKAAMKINYFDDVELINAQAEKFGSH